MWFKNLEEEILQIILLQQAKFRKSRINWFPLSPNPIAQSRVKISVCLTVYLIGKTFLRTFKTLNQLYHTLIQKVLETFR
jgi:hypothetical protein